MTQNDQNFHAIAIEYLYDGLILKDDIYSYNRKAVLLKEGETITDAIIDKLRNFNSNNRNIYVSKETYDSLKDKSNISRVMGQQELEDRYGYTRLKETAGALFRMRKYSEHSETLERKQVQEVVAEIALNLTATDRSMIFQCINAPRPMDEILQRHCLNVSFLNGLFGEWLELPDEEVDMLVLIGLLHDIGKTQIPEEILNSPDKLSREQFETMKMHTIYSYDMLCDDDSFDDKIRMAVRQHHEKIDGGGYPDNLMGSEITQFAKITSVSDIYDAMVSKRSYKTAKNPFSVLQKFANGEFSGLDQSLVALFLKNMPQQLVNKQVLMSDGTIGTIRYLLPNDLENPIVDVDGEARQGGSDWYCVQLVC